MKLGPAEIGWRNSRLAFACHIRLGSHERHWRFEHLHPHLERGLIKRIDDRLRYYGIKPVHRWLPRIMVVRPEEVHDIHIAARGAEEACMQVPGGPTPPERTERYGKLADRFEALDTKDWIE